MTGLHPTATLTLGNVEYREPWRAVHALAWSPDGRRLLAAGRQVDEDVVLGPGAEWDVVWLFTPGGLLEREIRVSGAGAAFSPDGARIASGSPLQVWDADSGARVGESPDGGDGVVAWSPSGDRIALAHGRVIRLLATDPPGILRELRGGGAGVCSLVFPPDGRSLAVGDHSPGLSGWDLQTGRRRWRLDSLAIPPAFPPGAWYSPDGALLATLGGPGGGVSLRNSADAREISCLGGGGNAALCADWSPDGRLLVAGDTDGFLRAYDTANGSLRFNLGPGTWGEPRVLGYRRLAWSPDGVRLAAVFRQDDARYDFALRFFDVNL